MDFCKAAEEVKNLPKKPSDADLLRLYSLFKQGIEGDNTTSISIIPWLSLSLGRPSFYEFKNAAKWDAWTKLKGLLVLFVNYFPGLSREAAQKEYIALAASLKYIAQ